MKILLLSLAVILNLQAKPVNLLIESAQKNENIESLILEEQAKTKEIESLEKDYFPKIEAGHSRTYLDSINSSEAKNSGTTYIVASVNIFDGNKKKGLIEAISHEVEALKHNKNYLQKNLSFYVIAKYLQILSAKENLMAKKQKNLQLQEERLRLEKFLEAGKTTAENVSKIVSKEALNRYEMENLELEIENLKGELEKLSKENFEEKGGARDGFEKFTFKNPKFLSDEIEQKRGFRDDIGAKKSEAQALKKRAIAIDSEYMPTIKLKNSYNFYDRTQMGAALEASEPLEHQNRLSLDFNIVLYDFDAKKKEQERLFIKEAKSKTELNLLQREALIDEKLAKKAIETSIIKIQAAKSRLESAVLTSDFVTQKFHAGLVSIVDFLDALSDKYDAIAVFEGAKYDYELKKAAYYIAAGFDPKEFLE